MGTKRLLAIFLSIALFAALFTSCGAQQAAVPTEVTLRYPDAHVIIMNDKTTTIDGAAIQEFNYTWHIDPSKESEWYEGVEPKTEACAYIASDIWYYPELDTAGFTKQNYDGETEWVYYYTAEGLTDYIFSTLPCKTTDLPTEMMHSAEEAAKNKVLHIREAGTYILQGNWHGQIFVDLGDKDETFTDEDAKVILILAGCDVTCDCAPAVIFYSVYECDNMWEEAETHSGIVDTKNAGANVIIADGTENNFVGANVFRLLKAKYKKDSTSVQKKAHKTDGAFYSFVSMNVNGESVGNGILNITSTTFEGLNTELHMTINGGYINIYSQDDGINVNEDNVSVFTMNGGTLHIFAGLGAEGDCVDSNGWITINGGLIAAGTPSGSDEVLDSDCGNTINGGTVIGVGSGRDLGGGFNPNQGDRDFGGNGNFGGDGQFDSGQFDPNQLPNGQDNFGRQGGPGGNGQQGGPGQFGDPGQFGSNQA